MIDQAKRTWQAFKRSQPGYRFQERYNRRQQTTSGPFDPKNVLYLAVGIVIIVVGVLVALTIPARHRIDAPTFVRRAHRLLHHLEAQEVAPSPMLTDEAQQSAVIELEELCEQVQAPLQKLEHTLHPWVQFGIMPIFAIANAGVAVSLGALTGAASPVLLGIVLGLVLGKPLGVLGLSWLAVRVGLVTLPPNVTWRHMIGVSVLAGIGFTMSLFIASLAFADADVLATAKVAILVASLLAGTAGLVLLRRLPQPTRIDDTLAVVTATQRGEA